MAISKQSRGGRARGVSTHVVLGASVIVVGCGCINNSRTLGRWGLDSEHKIDRERRGTSAFCNVHEDGKWLRGLSVVGPGRE